jgi:hypothetical protein
MHQAEKVYNAGVVQRLVCGLAKAETAVRFCSLAPD